MLLGPLWGLCQMFLQPGPEPVAHQPSPLAQEQKARLDHYDEAIGLHLGTLHKLGWHCKAKSRHDPKQYLTTNQKLKETH